MAFPNDLISIVIHIAVVLSNPPILKTILEHFRGIDINARDTLGRTPLHECDRSSYSIQMAQLLLDYGASPFILDVFGPSHFSFILFFSLFNFHISIFSFFIIHSISFFDSFFEQGELLSFFLLYPQLTRFNDIIGLSLFITVSLFHGDDKDSPFLYGFFITNSNSLSKLPFKFSHLMHTSLSF
jgi:ankyrin repeat protein